jgi:threonylcarbamoyladenosine tRNA methylthiotransferase MtaB
MPQLQRSVVKARAAELRAAAEARRSRWLDSLVGSTQTVLMESGGKGHSDSFAPVAVAGSARGDLVTARIAMRDGAHLVGLRA